MESNVPKQFDSVSVVCKANIYFDGKVVSHTVLFPNGSKKSLGILFSGSYHFNTDAPERMDIISGSCRVKLKGDGEWRRHEADSFFEVPGKSAFDIAVDEAHAEYVCSYL
jgi:purine/pyrimidine-nucleoside phosphorylase